MAITIGFPMIVFLISFLVDVWSPGGPTPGTFNYRFSGWVDRTHNKMMDALHKI